MKKTTRKLPWVCLLGCLLAVMLCGTALAGDSFNFQRLAITQMGNGSIYVYGETDYYESANTNVENFSAKTENGDLVVESISTASYDGISWFVILDYGKNDVNSGYVTSVEDRMLKDLAALVSSKDNGALILCEEDNTPIELSKADRFREMLTTDHGATNGAALASTLQRTIDYIETHSHNEHVAIVIITSGQSATTSIRDRISTILSDPNNSIYSTYILAATASGSVAKDKNDDGWYKRSERLVTLARLTYGGQGYKTEKLSDDEADKAVDIIRNSTRKLVTLVLDPVERDNIGKRITVYQTTTGGQTLEDTMVLTDSAYETWLEYFKIKVPDVTAAPIRMVASGYLSYDEPDITTTSSGNTGFSTELLIGIILGVVILALVIVLIAVNAGKKKIKSNYVPTTTPQTPKGTVVTLKGSTGTYRKTMQNGCLTIGRDATRGAMLAFPNDGRLTALHCTLTKQGNTMTLTDNHSTNGTKLNGVQVKDPVTVRQNDRITMGSDTYTITWGEG